MPQNGNGTTITATENVTKVKATENTTSISISPVVTTVLAKGVSVHQSAAGGIDSTAAGFITATNVNDALSQIGNNSSIYHSGNAKLTATGDGIQVSGDIIIDSSAASNSPALSFKDNDGTATVNSYNGNLYIRTGDAAGTSGKAVELQALNGGSIVNKLGVSDTGITMTGATHVVGNFSVSGTGSGLTSSDWKTAYTHSQTSHAPANATANDTDENLLARANHTGTQAKSTIVGLEDSLNSIVDWSTSQTANIHSSNYTDTTYSLATTLEDGLMSKTLKEKLDDIEAGANITDTTNVVSALTAGDNVTIESDGTVKANVIGALSAGTGIAISNTGEISVSDYEVSTVQTAASESAQLALTVTQGGIVVRTDTNKTYIHNGGTADTMADFTDITPNTSGVQSINTQSGVVTLTHDGFSDFVANEHIDWTTDQGATNIHSGNYTNTTYSAATTSAEGLMSSADKTAVDGIIDWTTDQGVTNIHSGNYTDTTYSAATTSAEGLMSSADKTAVDGIIDWTTDQGDTNIHTGNYINKLLDLTDVPSTAEGFIKITQGNSGASLSFDTNTYLTASAGLSNFSEFTTLEDGKVLGVANGALAMIDQTGSGGSGGTTYTAGAGINIDADDNIKISWDSSTSRFNEIKFNNAYDSNYSGIYLKAFDDSVFSGAVHGLNMYYDDPNDPDAPTVHIAAFTDSTVAFQSEFQASAINVAGTKVLSDIPYDSPYYSSHRRIELADVAVNTRTDEQADMSIESNKRRIANAQYVHDVVDEAVVSLGAQTVPEPSSQFHHNRVLAYTNDNNIHWRTNRAGSVIVSEDPILNLDDNQVQLFTYQWETGLNEPGIKITAGTGVTLTTSAFNDLTISANPDGLPDQNSNLDGYVLKTNGSTAEWSQIGEVVLPVQTDASGKFLTTDGTTASWADVDAFPDQGGKGGKYLTTDGVDTVSWADVDALPVQYSGLAGKYLTTDGFSASWTTAPSLLPDQEGHQNKYLVTDGSNTSWQTVNTAGQTGNISFSGSTISSSDTDTVTIGDKMLIDDELTASKLILNGADQPKVVSNASYEITAPDGVTHNSMPLPTYQFKLYLNSGQTNTPNLSAFNDMDVSKSEDKVYTIEFTGGNGTYYETSVFYVVANYTCIDQQADMDDVLTNIIIRKEGNGFKIKVVDKNGSADGVKQGYLFIQVYDYL